GSLGLDLATAVEVKLLDKKPQKASTGVYGPVKINGIAVGCLLIGRSSATMLGLLVATGLIDKDYEGEIKIMVSTQFPPLVIPKGGRIAQLIPLPHLAAGIALHSRQVRGDGGFGSSTAPRTMLTAHMTKRPQITVEVTYQCSTISLQGLLDTGADVSVIS
ncbi:hypothetical protein N300_00925, partial [Calypte anna]